LAFNAVLVFIFSCFLYLISFNVSFQLLLASFLITFSVYCLNDATDKKEDSLNKPGYKSKSGLYYIVPSVISMITGLWIGFLSGWLTLIVLTTPLIIGFLYSVPLVKSIPRLKEIVGVKSIVVAISWAVTGAMLPLTIQIVELNKIVLVFIYIFVILLVNTVICDVLDMKGDLITGLHTIPSVLGRKRSQTLLSIINSILVIWLIYCLLSGLFTNLLPALAFGVVYDYFLIWHFIKPEAQRFHAEIAIDGAWIPIVIIAFLI